MRRTLTALTLLLWSTTALAGRHAIEGQVLDRNGQPIDRAIISLDPGHVELVTDRDGRFLIDYLRRDDGQRTRMAKKTLYTLEVFKPGFHTTSLTIDYRKGTLVLDQLTLTEETIELREDDTILDPGAYEEQSESTGVSYEGQ